MYQTIVVRKTPSHTASTIPSVSKIRFLLAQVEQERSRTTRRIEPSRVDMTSQPNTIGANRPMNPEPGKKFSDIRTSVLNPVTDQRNREKVCAVIGAPEC